jgi:putative inorganic carbon (hco3(-)) transporter
MIDSSTLTKPFMFENNYPKVNFILLLSLCGYVLEWYLEFGYRIPFLGTIRFEFIYGSILVVVALFMHIPLQCPLYKFLILYFLALIVQIPFSHDFDYSWFVFTNRIIKFACLSLFIIVFVKSPRDLRFFIGAFLLACLKLGQEGFWGSVITHNLVWENQGVPRLHGATPLYGHPNSFSGMAMGTLPFIIYLFPVVSSKIIRGFLLVLCIFSCNIVLYSGSRTSYVAFFIFLIFVFIGSKAKKKLLMFGLPLLIVGSCFLPPAYVERFNSIFTGKEKEGASGKERKLILKDAWQIFLDHPLGVGVSAFPKVRFEKFGRTQDTHNLYFEVLTNLGVHGFIIFFSFVFALLKMLNKLKRSFEEQLEIIKTHTFGNKDAMLSDALIKQHVSDLQFLQAISSAVFLFVIIRLALGLFGMDLYEIYWWFASGITIALFFISNTAQQKTQSVISALVNNSDCIAIS